MIIRKANPLDAAGIAKVAVDTWKTAYRGIISDEVLAGLSYEQKEKNWFNTLTSGIDIVFVAEDANGEIIGYSSGGKERRKHSIYQGELYTLYVLQSHQKLGIGKGLLVSVVRELAELQIRSLFVGVLEANPSRFFYEALGGKKVDKKSIVIGGTSLNEIGYGWEDTSNMLS